MKKILAILMVMLLTLTGCVSENKKEDTAAPEASVSAVSSTQTENEDTGYEEAVAELDEPDLS